MYPQNCDFVRMDDGTKDESAWCGIMVWVQNYNLDKETDKILQFVYVTNMCSSNNPSNPNPTLVVIPETTHRLDILG